MPNYTNQPKLVNPAAPTSVVNSSLGSTNNTSMLQFPKDLGNYAMIFMFEEYDYAKTGSVVGKQERNAAGSLVLPLPLNGLSEGSRIALNDVSLGLLGAGVATGISGLLDKKSPGEILKNTVGIDGNNIGNYTSGITNDNFVQVIMDQFGGENGLLKVGSKLGSFAARGFSNFLPGVNEGIDVATGTAFNNFTTLQFTGVGLRTHEFSWRFFPEDENESLELTKIRKKLMQASHPSYSEPDTRSVLGRALLKYPLLVKPYILINDSETYYYQFKPCLIESVSMVFKTEQGSILLKGGKPAVVELSMTLKETGIWIADEF